MYKLKLAMMSLGLCGMTLFVGGSLATMQDRATTGSQTNQNNSNQNRNTNGNSNRNRNNNMNSDSMMNSNSMMNSQTGGMIGNMTMEEFMRINAEGAAQVAAITPSSAALSNGDQKLMMEVAMGGMMQLEVSRAALEKVTDPQARLLAQSEVEEQTGLSQKLQEIARAKNVTLPTSPDSKTRSMIAKMQERSAGADFDRYYVRESGVKGHEKLDKTMSKVETKANDDALKSLAAAAHPLVRTHLQVSREVVGKMSGNNRGNTTNNSGNANRSSNGNSNSNSNSNR